MIEDLKKEFKKEFGIEPLIPEPYIIKGDKLFEISEGVKRVSLKIEPLNQGLLLAYGSKPSHRLLEYNKNRVKNYIVLNDKSSFLFTCNRRVLKKGIVEKHGKGPVYAAFNQNKEVLGVIQYKKGVYHNRVNIGVYFKEDDLNEVIF